MYFTPPPPPREIPAPAQVPLLGRFWNLLVGLWKAGMRKWRWFSLLLIPIALAGAAWWWWAEPHPAEYGTNHRSRDLSSDVRRMWETERLTGSPDPTHGPSPRGSTDRAINAASRVFNTADLGGKTREEVVTLLGDPATASNSIYNFPFSPAPPGALVYRFDTGKYGRQYNVLFGADGRVRGVEQKWIH